MKFWISKNSEVPVRDQLVTQVAIAIASGDIKPGERLPSTREIARRYGPHPNTVAAAYQALVDDSLIEFRHGSGYFVRRSTDRPPPGDSVESSIDALLAAAAEHGMSVEELLARIRRRGPGTGLRRLLLIESDPALRDILIHEIDRAIPADIAAITFEEFVAAGFDDDAVLTAFFDEKPKIEPLLTNGRKCIFLNGRSVATVLSAETRPSTDETIAVVSGWKGFLTIARIMLTAAKVEPGNVIIRSRDDEGWQEAIKRAGFVICDSLTATLLPDDRVVKDFSVVSDGSIDALSRALRL